MGRIIRLWPYAKATWQAAPQLRMRRKCPCARQRAPTETFLARDKQGLHVDDRSLHSRDACPKACAAHLKALATAPAHRMST
eukprot:3721584-Pyramimonas_sp.AAC.1